MQSFTINTGAQIPARGLGTWQSAPGQVKQAVAHSLGAGYNHIDCAFCYGNEDEVGAGLREAFESGVRREDVFITTKLWTTFSSRVEEGLDLSLKSLGLSYVDLYLVHWPLAMNPNGEIVATFTRRVTICLVTSSQATISAFRSVPMAREISTFPGHTNRPGSRWRSCSRQGRFERSEFATIASGILRI